MEKKYIIWLPEEEAMKLCQKYEMEDYYFGIDPIPQKEKKDATII